MKTTNLKNKVLAAVLCGVMTMGTSMVTMAQDVQPVKATTTMTQMATTGDGNVYVSAVDTVNKNMPTGLGGTGLMNFVTVEIYDNNWNKLPCSYNRQSDQFMTFTTTWTTRAPFNGVILFFDAYHNQIGGSVLQFSGVIG
jgi:hypothetical protein